VLAVPARFFHLDHTLFVLSIFSAFTALPLAFMTACHLGFAWLVASLVAAGPRAVSADSIAQVAAFEFDWTRLVAC
jgi:hypothetical protein